MTNQIIEELCKVYGIEITDVEPGKGGIFYTDSDGSEKKMGNPFEQEDLSVPIKESITIKSCKIYLDYADLIDLLSTAA